ncbi:MAG: DUF2239 family protein [Burkholderiaceae bacterium]
MISPASHSNAAAPLGYSGFEGHSRIASGSLADCAAAIHRAQSRAPTQALLVFDDDTGQVVDIDARGTADEVRARYERPATDAASTATPPAPNEAGAARGRGRPRLGVVAREVTLLPRHWEWLAEQPGGASVALRKLVEAARRAGRDAHDRRRAHDRAYRFMAAIAGNLPGYEEAIRALFANDRDGFSERVAGWPGDVRTHALQLGFGA